MPISFYWSDQFISLLCPILTHFLLLIWQKLPIINDNVMFPYVYIVIVPYTYIVTLVNPLYFLFFVIFVIYRPRFCPFVHFVIVLYCIYAFWVVSTREINLRSTTSTAGIRNHGHLSFMAGKPIYFWHSNFCLAWNIHTFIGKCQQMWSCWTKLVKIKVWSW